MKIHDDTINEFLINFEIKPVKTVKNGNSKWSLQKNQINSLLDYYLLKNYLLNRKLLLQICKNITDPKLADKYSKYINSLETKLKQYGIG